MGLLQAKPSHFRRRSFLARTESSIEAQPLTWYSSRVAMALKTWVCTILSDPKPCELLLTVVLLLVDVCGPHPLSLSFEVV